MVKHERVARLHDRATRGDPLSADEHAELNEWYSEQDRLEMELLEASGSGEAIHAVQRRLDAILVRIAESSERIRALSARNDELRQEIADLKRLMPAASPRGSA